MTVFLFVRRGKSKKNVSDSQQFPFRCPKIIKPRRPYSDYCLKFLLCLQPFPLKSSKSLPDLTNLLPEFLHPYFLIISLSVQVISLSSLPPNISHQYLKRFYRIADVLSPVPILLSVHYFVFLSAENSFSVSYAPPHVAGYFLFLCSFRFEVFNLFSFCLFLLPLSYILYLMILLSLSFLERRSPI